MKKLNISDANVVELTNDELVDIDGGLLVAILVAAAGFAIGFALACYING